MRGKIAVIGCGTGGAAMVLLLHRMGYDVSVFERVYEPGPVGAGIQIQANGLMVLRELGLYEEAVDTGKPLHYLIGETVHGKRVLDFDYRKLHPDYFGLGIHRGALFNILYREISGLPVSFYTGVEIVRTEKQGRQRVVMDIENNEYGPFDLVIGADGARSQLREHVFMKDQVRVNPWAALWVCAPAEDNYFSNDVVHQVYQGTKRMVGFMPIGKRPGVNHDEHLVNIFWSIPYNKVGAWREAGLDAWKKEVLAMVPGAADLLAHIKSIDEVTVAPYYEVRFKRFTADRFSLIGDAAHAMSPQLSQGTNFALFDAWELAESLNDNPDYDAALQDFERRRRRQVNYYQTVSRYVTPCFQSSLPLAFFRNHFFGMLSRIPSTHKMMLETLSGIKKDLFSNIHPSKPVFPSEQ